MEDIKEYIYILLIMDYKKELEDLIKTVIGEGGSDIHIASACNPWNETLREYS